MSNAQPLVFYLGLNYSRRKQPPPLRREWILDSILPFDGGIVRLQYIPPERLFWDQAPAAPLMTSSISWGLLEHDYGDLQFIHICCCVEFLCTWFSCSELCDLLLWASGTANSQQWISKDHIKTNSVQCPYRTTCVDPPICTVHICSLYWINVIIILLKHTSVTVTELHYSRVVIVSYKNSINYIASDRCHVYHPHMNRQLTLLNMMKVDNSAVE